MNPTAKLAAAFAAAAMVIPSGAYANTSAVANQRSAQANAVSSNQGVNNQHNSGSVTLNPMGGSQTNINQNNAFSSTYSFGPGISCPTPSVALSAFGAGGDSWGGGYSSGSGNYGGSLSFILPIGGSIGADCAKLAAEIAQQRVLDTQVNMIKVCSHFAAQGVVIDTAKFPEFEVCSGVTVAGRQAVEVEPRRVFTPPEAAVPVVPVNKQ